MWGNDKNSGEVLALALLSAGEASHAFSAFLPSRFTIRNWVVCGTPEEVRENVANLRSGYRPAALFGLGLGAVISVIARSPLPVVFAAATTVAMVKLYEAALPPEMQLQNPFDVFRLPEGPHGDVPGESEAVPALMSAAGLVVGMGI